MEWVTLSVAMMAWILMVPATAMVAMGIRDAMTRARDRAMRDAMTVLMMALVVGTTALTMVIAERVVEIMGSATASTVNRPATHP